MSILGTTKLTQDGKITLISDVRKKLDVKGGDVIVFRDDGGKITISKG